MSPEDRVKACVKLAPEWGDNDYCMMPNDLEKRIAQHIAEAQAEAQLEVFKKTKELAMELVGNFEIYCAGQIAALIEYQITPEKVLNDS